jgi:hypothetical protein
VTAKLELGVDQFLAGSRAKLFEPGHLDVYEGLEREVGQGRPAPEAECLAQELCTPLCISTLRRLRDESLEAV